MISPSRTSAAFSSRARSSWSAPRGGVGRASTAAPAAKVDAPLIAECYASFECRLVDTSLIRKYSLFILKVVKAHVATAPRFPRTLHYRGDGLFMLAGPTVSRYRRWFKPENL